ncbi:hypothetical protein [Ferrovibrio sp.]|uniref:hypothetical protein n=1 Tax=Ferrovibrio sp. TaxID=1917215 RepID=UPI00311E8DF8
MSESGHEPKEAGAVEPDRDWVRSTLDRMIDFGTSRIRFLRHWKMRRETLEFYKDGRDSDDEENRKSTPPDDVKVETLSIWAVELFASSQLDALLNAIERQGWAKVRRNFRDETPAEWLRKRRYSFGGGSSMPLGSIVPVGHRGFPGFYAIEGVIPAFARIVSVEVYCATSSLTCVAVRFDLKDEEIGRHEAVSRTTFQTSIKPRKNGSMVVFDPWDHKANEIRTNRDRWRSEAITWMRQHYPGIFANSDEGLFLPTFELLTLSNAVPFDRSKGRGYLDLFGLEVPGASFWVTPDDDLYLAGLVRHSGEDEHHSLIVVQKEKFDSGNAMKPWGGSSRSGYISRVSSQLRYSWVLPALSVGPLLRLYGKRLAIVRDQLSYRSTKSSLAKQMHQLAALVADNFDMVTICEELSSKHRPRFWWKSMFIYADKKDNEWKGKELSVALEENAKWRVGVILKTEAMIRDLLLQYGNLTSARRNALMQRSVYLLTIVLVFLSLLMIDWKRVSETYSVQVEPVLARMLEFCTTLVTGWASF